MGEKHYYRNVTADWFTTTNKIWIHVEWKLVKAVNMKEP